jgi:molybdopterin converting factor small subunit
MEITVRFQGIIADMLGRKTERLVLPDGATVDDLYAQLTESNDTARAILKQTRPFINGQQADRAESLSDGAEVIFMRPIAGGSPHPYPSPSALGEG